MAVDVVLAVRPHEQAHSYLSGPGIGPGRGTSPGLIENS